MSKQNDRRSPPAAAASKRDRRRQNLLERVASLNEKFNREKDFQYRDQLQKIQLELGLVQRFNPYEPQVLDTISELQREHQEIQGQQAHNPENSRSLMEQAGLRFPDFIDEVEDLIESRDFHLTSSKNEYDRKVVEYKNTHAYKYETAKREHKALTATLRDRLINTMNQKKTRLTREKEVLEINDSSALLLNPNQFSLTNPASPGGTHGKRATRLRKDAEDLSLFPDGKKRKRNNNDDDGSPGPMRRTLDNNNTTALWQSEKARAAAKQDGRIYSLDKLFTDKELSMHYNTAALAAHQFILRHRTGNGSSPDDSDFENDGDGDNDSVPSAPIMERQVSHATRSTRGGAQANFLDDKLLGLEAIANLELPGNLDLLHKQEPPKMPPPVPQQYLKPYPRTADQNLPLPLSQDDINSDITVMGLFKQYDQTHKPGSHLDAGSGLRRILEAVSTPYQQSRFTAFTGASREEPENLRDVLGLPATTSSVRDEPSPSRMPQGLGAGGVPMSRQSSLGGVAMSRQGSGTRSKVRRG